MAGANHTGGALTSYEIGLGRIFEQVTKDHSRYSEALVYQQRLRDNISDSSLYGDTEILRAPNERRS